MPPPRQLQTLNGAACFVSSDDRFNTPSGSGKSAEREPHVTQTGWRAVGRAIPLVEQAAAGALLSRPEDDDVLFAARFHLRPRLGRHRAVDVTLHALTEAVRRHWPDAPPLLPDRPLSRPPEQYHGLRWDTQGEPGAWTGELVWRHPHPVVRGAPCTTHLIVSEHGTQTVLSLRVGTDGGMPSVRGTVGGGQSRPAF